VDYHVEVDRHYYSVPYTLIKQLVHVRLTVTTVECFFNGQRVASHVRSYQKGKHTTLSEHMPTAHQKYSQWSPEHFLNWAIDIGSATRDVIKYLLTNKAHPEQSYRACFAILSSAKRYGKERLESACKRALAIGAPRRHSILSILKNGLDKQPLAKTVSSSNIKMHGNIRGADHYQNELSFSQTKP
jgi:transposase